MAGVADMHAAFVYVSWAVTTVRTVRRSHDVARRKFAIVLQQFGMSVRFAMT